MASKTGSLLASSGSGAAQGFAMSGGNPYGAAIGAGVGLIGGLLASGDDESSKYYQQALQGYQDLGYAPDVASSLAYQDTKTVATYNPTMIEEMKAYESKVGEMTQDQGLLDQRMKAISDIGRGATGGLTPTQALQLEQAKQQANQVAKSQNEALLQNMQQRGIAGGGNELVARQMANQNAQNQLNTQGMQLYAQSDEARKNALQDYLKGLTQYQGDINEFGFKTNTAKDVAQQAAWQNSAKTRQLNAAAQTEAQALNTQRANQVQDINTATRNKLAYDKANFTQNQYSQNLNRLSGISAIYGSQAENEQKQNQAENKQTQGYLDSGVTALAGYYGNKNKKDEPKNIYNFYSTRQV